MTIYEHDLPGVGKKHEVDLGDGSRLVVVTRNNGKRKVLRRASADGGSEKLFGLADELVRQMRTFLENAYFQSVQTRTIETLLGDNTLIEWVEVGVNSDIVDKALDESDPRRTTGTSVTTIERGDKVVASPDGDATAETGDTLVVIGPKTACCDFIVPTKGA